MKKKSAISDEQEVETPVEAPEFVSLEGTLNLENPEESQPEIVLPIGKEKIEFSHDPREFIRGIQQILISGTKRIGFLCGAGTSMATPMTNKDGEIMYDEQPSDKRRITPMIPGVWKMTELIVHNISDDKLAKAILEIKDELADDVENPLKKDFSFMIENIISNIDQKIRVIGKKGILCGLDKAGLIELRGQIISQIKNLVSVHSNEEIKLDTKHLVHQDFARYIKYATRKFPIEVFTTNYDYLFEYAFEGTFLPYFDGFVGGFNPFFDPTSVENDYMIPQWTRLWKLHGSLGWKYSEHEKRIVRSRTNTDDSIVIYPSLLKYDDSRKQPYSSYIDRLSTFIKKDDGVLFICGYSFGDDHINGTIMNALAQTRSSTIIALIFDKDLNEDSNVIDIAKRSNKIMICGNKCAMIGGVFADWKLKREPPKEDFEFIDQFFDANAPEPHAKKGKGDETSLLKGELSLVDFAKFVNFLISLSYPTTFDND